MERRIRPRRRRLREYAGLILAGLFVAIGILFLSLNDVKAGDPPILPKPSPWPSESIRPWRTAPPRPHPVVVGHPHATPAPKPVRTLPPTDT